MSTITKQVLPYEFLLRLMPGCLPAAHVGMIEIYTEDGEVKTTQALPVQSVALGEAAGFPLSELQGILDTELLKANEALDASNVQLGQLVAAKDAELQEKQQDIEGYIEAYESLTAQVAGLNQHIAAQDAEIERLNQLLDNKAGQEPENIEVNE